MNRRDDSKVSLVEFLRSIKFDRAASAGQGYEAPGRLAVFSPRIRRGGRPSGEDAQLIRSAN